MGEKLPGKKEGIPIVDMSKSYRYYLSDHFNLDLCPECGGNLTVQLCMLKIFESSGTLECDSIVNLADHSRFCKTCPVVVIDNKAIQEIIAEGIDGEPVTRYSLKGLIDVEAVPKDKRRFDQLGTPGNPIPVVPFLPPLETPKVRIPKRNEPCICGSGRKFKNCCAKLYG